MTVSADHHHRYSKGGLFRRLVIPLVLLILNAGFVFLYNAYQIEKKRHRDRLESIATSNAKLFEKLSLPLSGRLAKDLSTTSGVTIILSDPNGKLTSPVALDEPRLLLLRESLKTPGQVVSRNNHQAFAAPISKPAGKALIALEPIPRWSLFGASSLAPSILTGLLLALIAAFIISRSTVRPLGNIVSSLQTNPGNTALDLPPSLLQQRDEIGILARELVSNRRQLMDEQIKRQRAERLAMLGRLTTSLAHEIKNPAASIIMHGQSLEKHEHHPVGPLIREEGEQIVSLVNQWLFVANPSSTGITDNDLVSILDHLLEKLQPVFEFHAITVESQLPEKLPLRCDAQRLELVFRNLLTNSIHAMPEGGKITLSAANEDSWLSFAVADQGSGFSRQALEHFGDAFFSEREGGMGLGLTLVKEVIQAHGGRVQAANNPDGGAIVSGKLPRPTSEDINSA